MVVIMVVVAEEVVVVVVVVGDGSGGCRDGGSRDRVGHAVSDGGRSVGP